MPSPPVPALRALVALAAIALVACRAGDSTASRPTGALPSSPPLAPGDHPRVVVVSIDGMRPDYYLKADEYGLKIPTLRALMKAGRYADGLTSVFPTVTYPAHTTLVTGARPAKHGISANGPFDPLYTNHGGWNWYAESIKVDTLWAAAARAGLTTGSSFWPVTVGAAIDFDFPQIWRATNDEDDKLVRALVTPRGMATDFEAHDHRLPAEHRSDHERADAAAYLLREKRPALTLVYFTDLDNAQHRSGPATPDVFATLERIDAELARVVDAAGEAGRPVAFVVVSDHGFLPVRTALKPAVWLRQAGLIEVGEGGAVTQWQAGVLAAGGLCGVVARDAHDRDLTARIDKVLRDVSTDPAGGVRRVYARGEIERAGGFGESQWALEAAPGFEFVGSLEGPAVGPSAHRGAHGYPPELPEMRASLILAGAGVRQGASLGVVDMTRVAPTVARLLGVALRDAEGEPLGDALAP